MPSSASRQTPEIVSSRKTREAAGWGCTDWADPAEEYEKGATPPGEKRRQFSWISPKPLWESRNDKIARWLGDSTHHERKRWVEAQRRTGVDPKLPIRTYVDKETVAFMVLGDPGEGDDSQYQVLRPLRATVDGHRLHLHRQRRHLPGRGLARVPRQVLLALQGASRPHLRRSREPRLVRRAERVHDAALRRRPRPAAAVQGLEEPAQARLPRSHLARADGGAAGPAREDQGASVRAVGPDGSRTSRSS